MNPQGLDPQLMMLLAGAGIPTLLEAITKLIPKGGAKNPAAPSAQLPHRPGMRIEATGNGSTTIAPSMLQALMQHGQQQPGGGAPNPQQLLQMLAQRGAV